MYKALILILDGLGDRPSSILNGQTPLEAAHTPHMDKLAARGICGLVDPLAAGFPVDTHTGSAALMGMARQNLLNLARGPVEAAGIGLDLQPGEIFLRANFATLEDDGLTIVDRRAGRISEGVEDLCDVLQEVDTEDGISASVFPATQYRAVVRLRGDGLSPHISDTDPGSMPDAIRLLSSQALSPADAGACRTAHGLNRFLQEAFKRLTRHPLNRQLEMPANALLTRGAGVVSRPRDMINQLGLSAALISGERTLHGLGQLLGFSVINLPSFTATSSTDLPAKFGSARAALANHDIVYVHIKATDIFSHSMDPRGKRAFIEKVDVALDCLLQDDLVVAVTADHSTDSNSGRHCGDPVPTVLCTPTGRVDRVTHFGENSCMQGGLGRIDAKGLLLSVLDAMGRLTNYHPFDAEFIDTTG